MRPMREIPEIGVRPHRYIRAMETVLLNTRFALECFERHMLDSAIPISITSEVACIGTVRELEQRMDGIPPASRPIVIAVEAKHKRNHSATYRCQVWSKPFPPHAIYQLPQSDICAASPAFCYLQMAAKLTLADAIRLGMELCGSHSTLPFATDIEPSFKLAERERKNGFTSRPPLITSEYLRTWIANSGHTRSRAAVAARYVIDNSRSPGESRLYIMLCLPAKMGGYGLPRPTLCW